MSDGATLVDDDLGSFVKEVIGECQAQSLPLFFGDLDMEDPRRVVWNEKHGGGGYHNFLSTAKRAATPFIYLSWIEMNQLQIDQAIEDEEMAESSERRAIRARNRKLEAYADKIGLTAAFAMAFCLNGVFHVFERRTGWFDEFLELANEFDLAGHTDGPHRFS